jgi:hypothetical protein
MPDLPNDTGTAPKRRCGTKRVTPQHQPAVERLRRRAQPPEARTLTFTGPRVDQRDSARGSWLRSRGR